VHLHIESYPLVEKCPEENPTSVILNRGLLQKYFEELRERIRRPCRNVQK
jgi:hypothetical protein